MKHLIADIVKRTMVIQTKEISNLAEMNLQCLQARMTSQDASQDQTRMTRVTQMSPVALSSEHWRNKSSVGLVGRKFPPCETLLGVLPFRITRVSIHNSRSGTAVAVVRLWAKSELGTPGFKLSLPVCENLFMPHLGESQQYSQATVN